MSETPAPTPEKSCEPIVTSAIARENPHILRLSSPVSGPHDNKFATITSSGNAVWIKNISNMQPNVLVATIGNNEAPPPAEIEPANGPELCSLGYGRLFFYAAPTSPVACSVARALPIATCSSCPAFAFVT